MNNDATKRCTKCQRVQPLSVFRRRHSCWCRDCFREYGRAYQRRYVARLAKTEAGRTQLLAYRANSKRVNRKNGYHARWAKRNRIKGRAHSAVHHALRTGALIRPNACGRCQAPCTPHAHHADYSKKLEVTWLCRQCHILEHAPHATFIPRTQTKKVNYAENT